jgi:hypothetical protein
VPRKIFDAQSLNPFRPEIWASAEMCDREDLNRMQLFSIEDYEWESPKSELP